MSSSRVSGDGGSAPEARGETVAEGASAASTGELLALLREVESRAAGLDIDAWETDAAAMARQMHALLERALTIMLAIQQLEEQHHAAAETTTGDDLDGWLSTSTPVEAPLRVGDVCFASTFELKRVVREIAQAKEPLDQLVAAESGRRKLRRAVHAMVHTARVTSGRDEEDDSLRPRHMADVNSALTVRRLYVTFRRSLRRPADHSPEAVLVALRYAAGSLAILIADPGYAEVRASDRALFRRLRDRILDWAAHGKPLAGGLELLEDLWTSSDLLRGINRRQELHAHDVALVHALSRGPEADPADWFARLEPLLGVDDLLDKLIERGRANPHRPDVLAETLQRLAELD